jgi:hypothetical protein
VSKFRYGRRNFNICITHTHTHTHTHIYIYMCVCFWGRYVTVYKTNLEGQHSHDDSRYQNRSKTGRIMQTKILTYQHQQQVLLPQNVINLTNVQFSTQHFNILIPGFHYAIKSINHYITITLIIETENSLRYLDTSV